MAKFPSYRVQGNIGIGATIILKDLLPPDEAALVRDGYCEDCRHLGSKCSGLQMEPKITIKTEAADNGGKKQEMFGARCGVERGPGW